MNMLVTIFFDICQRSILIMPVMLLALLLTLLFDLLRVPKRISYFVLVFTVLLRMVVPSLPASEFSYFNMAYVRSAIHRESIPDNGGYIGDYEITIAGSSEYQQALDAGLKPETDSDIYVDYICYTLDENGAYRAPETFREKYGVVTACVWAAGVVLFWGYGILSALLLKRRVATATLLEPGVYETDQITTPFILGVVRPVIYLPVGLSKDAGSIILSHERMHLRWGDHIIKLIAYFAVGLYWFHLWIGFYFYRIFMQVMEEACDQDVIRSLGIDKKADYSQALLNVSARKHLRSVVTVAFGESWVKERIKQVLKYKKPYRIVVLTASLLSLAAVLTLSTDGMIEKDTFIRADQTMSDASAWFTASFSESVGSMTMDLEVWTSKGRIQRQRILRVSDVYKIDNEEDFPIVWNLDTETMSWSISFRESTGRGILPAQSIETGEKMITTEQVSKDGLSVPVNGNAILYSMTICEDQQQSNASYVGIQQDDVLSVPEGQTVILLRMTLSHNRFPHGSSLQELLSCNFSKMKNWSIYADGVFKELSHEQRTGLLELLSDYHCEESYQLGVAELECGQDAPSVRLSNGVSKEHYLEVVICDGDVFCYDSYSGELHRTVGDHMDTRRIAGEIYRLLGLEKTAAQVYQLPQAVGEQAEGWTLLASDDRKDVWLYRNEIANELLIKGPQVIPVTLGEDAQILQLTCADFSGDGMEEIMLSSTSDGNARLTVFEPYGEEQYLHWISGQDLNHYMDTGFGEYLDDPDLHFLQLEEDYEALFLFSASQVLGEWADARYVHDPREPHYQDVLFYEEGGQIYVSATRVLHMKKDDAEAWIPCAKVSASIDFQPVSSREEPFRFYHVIIAPLS